MHVLMQFNKVIYEYVQNRVFILSSNVDVGVSHLRDIFYRMGLSDKDIVALSGGHTLVMFLHLQLCMFGQITLIFM